MKRITFSISILLFITLTGCSDRSKSVSEHSEAKSGNHVESADSSEHHEDHTVLILKKQPFASVVKTGGRIMVDSKDIIVITSKSSGIIKLNDHFLFPGVKVSKGQRLFTISGQQLADDNTELKIQQIKADLEEASLNFERARKMIEDKLITEERFLSSKNEYEKTLNEYNNLNSTSGKDGNTVSSPDEGYFREIFITEGQKVNSGQPLASIVIEHNLVLKADISPDYLKALASIEKANFRVAYSDRLFKTDEMNGKKISFGKSTGDNSFYIPVYFRMDYDPELIEGTFVEVYLISEETENAIVVPNTALMEEYGKIYVYVEDFDGDFLKRYVIPGLNNGEFTQILEGLAENETIVATGAYQVKLSQMSNSAPAHNH
jgi:RND family efflux transporter MFP subunit